MFQNVSEIRSRNFASFNDVSELLKFMNDFKNTLSGPEQALFKDLFDDFAQHFGGSDFIKFGMQQAAGASGLTGTFGRMNVADELLSVFQGLRDIPDLFQGRIPQGLDTIGTLEFVRDNLSPKYQAFGGTIDELIKGLKDSKIAGSELDGELADLMALIGNRNKPQMMEPANSSMANEQGAGMAEDVQGANGGVDMGQVVAKQQEENFRKTSGAKKGSNRSDSGSQQSGSIEGGRGGSIFEAIALALGEAMTEKLKDLLKAAEGVKSSDEDILEKSAQVTARGQELNAVSQAFNSSINSVGQAASTAARKT